MNNTDKWLNLRHSIKSCQKCEGLNSKELGTENAPGYGNTNSRIIFIGQSLCGKPCIEAQIPFTGGSGKLLDLAFEQANIEKKDIYITNVVKCHPDGNRKSEPRSEPFVGTSDSSRSDPNPKIGALFVASLRWILPQKPHRVSGPVTASVMCKKTNYRSQIRTRKVCWLRR